MFYDAIYPEKNVGSMDAGTAGRALPAAPNLMPLHMIQHRRKSSAISNETSEDS